MTFNDDRKQWRSVSLDYDKLILNPESEDECQYCLTDAQTKALIAIVELWRYKTRWFYDGTIIPSDVEQFVNDIQRRLMMSCCGDGINENSQHQRELEAFEFFKLDDGTPQSYAPDTRDYFNKDSTNSAEDQLRNNQLCIAVRDWVYAYIQEYLKYLSTVGAVLGAAAGIAFYTGNPVFGFIFGISAAIIDSLGAIAATDAAAVNKVICCMIYGLRDQTVTQEHFRHALDGCMFTFGTKEAQLAGALNSFNQTDENYRAFLVHLGQAKAAAYSDIDQCPTCGDCVIDDWDLWMHFGTLGAVVARGVDWIQLTSVTSGDFGAQAASIYSISGAGCFFDHYDVTGQNGSMATYYSVPPHDPNSTGGNINTSLAVNCGTEMNMITVYGGTSTFTVTIFFRGDDCT